MTENAQTSDVPSVREETRESLLADDTNVQTQVGHVAKFNQDEIKSNGEENVALNKPVNFKKLANNEEFVGLTKEELKSYIDNPKWKRIRWLIAILYILLLVFLLIGSILLVLLSQRCPPKPKLVWYQKEIVYEIDVTTFRDSNEDGIGDIKGIQEKLSYLKKNNMKSILLRSSIFNASTGISIQSDKRIRQHKHSDLLEIDPLVGNDKDLEGLLKVLHRRDMHLIMDLPLSSTTDPNGYLWYGSNSSLLTKIRNPCMKDQFGIGCRYYQSYGRLPLNLTDKNVYTKSEDRLRYWLSTKKVDGVRIDLPLDYDRTTGLYNVSRETIDRWTKIKNEIEKKTKPKLLLIDIPFGLQNMITDPYLLNMTSHPLFLFPRNSRPPITAALLDERIRSLETQFSTIPKFWQLGSKRNKDDIGVVDERRLPRELVLTMVLLLGGTPVILYGEEIGLDKKQYSLMRWTSDPPYGGFSSCSSNCISTLSSYRTNRSITNVKLQEAVGNEPHDSLLTVFRHLSKLRQYESFQFGLLESSYDPKTNVFWFIREAPGHRGYVIVFNLNKNPTEKVHISLHRLTKHDVPLHVHYDYQWPKIHLSTDNKTHIDSDNLIIHPQSINIFWWIPKLRKPNVLFKTAKEHSHNH